MFSPGRNVRKRAANDPSVLTIRKNAPTRAFFWLNAPTSAFKLKTLCQALSTSRRRPSRGLLLDYENRWIVCSSNYHRAGVQADHSTYEMRYENTHTLGTLGMVQPFYHIQHTQHIHREIYLDREQSGLGMSCNACVASVIPWSLLSWCDRQAVAGWAAAPSIKYSSCLINMSCPAQPSPAQLLTAGTYL